MTMSLETIQSEMLEAMSEEATRKSVTPDTPVTFIDLRHKSPAMVSTVQAMCAELECRKR